MVAAVVVEVRVVAKRVGGVVVAVLRMVAVVVVEVDLLLPVGVDELELVVVEGAAVVDDDTLDINNSFQEYIHMY